MFGFEVSGNEARAEHIENSSTVQWLRIGATVMLLPDIAVGGARALTEVGKLGSEAREATAASSEAARNAEAARARKAKISNPERHPGPVQRRTRKVAAFERAVEAQARAAAEAHTRIRMTVAKDLAIVPGASLGSTGLLMGAPPSSILSPAQRERDERYRRSLAPEGGMPKDVRLEMRVSGHSRVAPE